MAGKKTDTRQKMINMMYLVFIAMLALNISKEVLATIGVINEDLETSIQQLSDDNISKYATIDNLQTQPEYQVVYPYVNQLKEISNTYVTYIQDLKDKVLDSDKEGTKYVRDVENTSNKNKPNQEMTDYQIMDKSGPLDELFFERSELLPEGKEYEDNFVNFRKDLISIIDSIKINDPKYANDEIALANIENVVSDLDSRFDYPEDGMKLNSDGKELKFMDYEFKGFPLVASLSKMTKTQNNALYIENKLLSVILGEIASVVSGPMGLQAYLKTPKAQYFAGEIFDGNVIMGQKSSSFDFEDIDLQIIYPGSNQPRNLVEEQDFDVESGQILLKKRLNQTGNYKLIGSVKKKGDRATAEIPINEEFTIIERPSNAVVEPIRMNILWEGLKNPVNIALPGATGLQQVNRQGSNVVLSPTNIAGANFTAKPAPGSELAYVQVSGTVNGERILSTKKEFRVAKLPIGVGAIQSNGTDYPDKSTLSEFDILNGIITGFRPDLLKFYDLNIQVTKFSVQIPPQASFEVNGRFLLGTLAEDFIRQAPSGTEITFSGIEADAWEGNDRADAVKDFKINTFKITKR